jgi:uncharacterized membrane protein
MSRNAPADAAADPAADQAEVVEVTAPPGRLVWITMLLGSLASLLASFVLSVDAIRLAENPNTSFSCDINAVISCGTVGASWQASLLGFPNAFLGLVFEPIIITLAVSALAGVRFPRVIMAAAQGVYTIAIAFAYWLFYQSMFEIGALCPWCLLVTLATTLVFFELTYVNIRDNNLFLPARLQRLAEAAIRANVDVMAGGAWVALLIGSIVLRYGSALFS